MAKDGLRTEVNVFTLEDLSYCTTLWRNAPSMVAEALKKIADCRLLVYIPCTAS